ncbi:hypothetical protein OEZ85_005308 [Tetradesmus obliquus]|uniref:DUF1826 domain-containing protein n=1 Tax=Tetradesmus obliquus TaxID=3088 RepID=A0ABY8UL51_TETOB|nr:hypothetical protein OEZ85_005308 [Tetradesmus obliquus]
MAAAAAALFRGAWASKQIKASHRLEDLQSRQVNIVHVLRPEAAVQGVPAAQLLSQQQGRQAVLDLSRGPDAAIAYLLECVQQPQLQQQLQADLLQAAQSISSMRQVDHVRAKLECVTKQSCPQWHADTVGVRMLCTYAGPGTWYIENRHVTRHVNPWTGAASISDVEDLHAAQAGPGDLLFLKGNLCQGMAGAGAVHKSPGVAGEGGARLLLTVDDACC